MALKQIDQDTVYPNGKRGLPGRPTIAIVNENTAETEQRLSTLEGGSGGVSASIAALQAGLVDEAHTRAALDGALGARIDAEQIARRDADNALAAQVGRIPGKNLLMNCGFPVNCRGFAGGALALGVFGYDRWKGGNGGCNHVIDASTGVWTLTGPVQQVVENPQDAWGLPLTISVDSPSAPVSVYVGGQSGIITAGAGRRGITLTPHGSGNLLVELRGTAVTFSTPQLERGSYVTGFDHRGAALENALCRQYARTGTILGRGNGVGAGQVFITHSMRAKPAVSVANVSYVYSCSNLTIGVNATYVEFIVATTASWAFGCTYVLDAEL